MATDSVSVSHIDTKIEHPVEAEAPTGIKNLGNDNGVAYRIEFKKTSKRNLVYHLPDFKLSGLLLAKRLAIAGCMKLAALRAVCSSFKIFLFR